MRDGGDAHKGQVTAEPKNVFYRKIYGIHVKDHLYLILAIFLTAFLNIIVRPYLMNMSFEY